MLDRFVCFVALRPKSTAMVIAGPCWIEISHLRGRKFNQGRGLPSPWLKSDHKGEISLSNMDKLMMDCFYPTFRRFLSEHKN